MGTVILKINPCFGGVFFAWDMACTYTVRPMASPVADWRRGMTGRAPISDRTKSMLQREVVNSCPLCGNFERTGEEFTNHHINHDSSISDYWNLIRICQTCHDDLTANRNDGIRERKVKQVKRNLFRVYYGPEAYKTLIIAYENKKVTATPINALELIRDDYLKMHKKNVMTIGPATNISTFDTYEITANGKMIVEMLKMIR